MTGIFGQPATRRKAMRDAKTVAAASAVVWIPRLGALSLFRTGIERLDRQTELCRCTVAAPDRHFLPFGQFVQQCGDFVLHVERRERLWPAVRARLDDYRLALGFSVSTPGQPVVADPAVSPRRVKPDLALRRRPLDVLIALQQPIPEIGQHLAVPLQHRLLFRCRVESKEITPRSLDLPLLPGRARCVDWRTGCVALPLLPRLTWGTYSRCCPGGPGVALGTPVLPLLSGRVRCREEWASRCCPAGRVLRHGRPLDRGRGGLGFLSRARTRLGLITLQRVLLERSFVERDEHVFFGAPILSGPSALDDDLEDLLVEAGALDPLHCLAALLVDLVEPLLLVLVLLDERAQLAAIDPPDLHCSPLWAGVGSPIAASAPAPSW